jgi:hypothetical protein
MRIEEQMTSTQSNSRLNPADQGVRINVKPLPEGTGTADNGAGALGEIDVALEAWSARRHAAAVRQAGLTAERDQFELDAATALEGVIKPAMQAAADRLAHDGGGGRVEGRPSGEHHGRRVVLWMSLEGEVADPPHQDHNPYLQLDFDVANRRVDVWEGDMWEKQGSSRATEPWTLRQITPEFVTEHIIAIVRRAVSHEAVV